MTLFAELILVFFSSAVSLLLARVIDDELLVFLIVLALWSPARVLYEFFRGGLTALLASRLRKAARK